jgi:cell pole-organizing protein PopZ
VEPEEQAPPPNEEPSSKNLHRPDEEGIASSKTLAASAAALKQLKPEPAREVEHRAERVTFRSGLTLEDLVLEALRPMLREWVDTNMPPMVERMVAKEIQKIRNQIS